MNPQGSGSRGADGSYTGGAAAAAAQEHSDELSSGFDSDEEYGWVPYFLSLKGNEFFCQVDEDYLHDQFNLVGLATQVTYYDYALDLITDMETEENFSNEHREMIENDADMLYGLIHARYILTTRGLHKMREKFMHSEFGCCPRAFCQDQGLLPVGITDLKGKESVKLYCARCEDIYNPPSSRHHNTDGAYFGSTFAHLFFLVFPELKPNRNYEKYIPRVFGFRIHRSSHEKALAAKKKQHPSRAH